MSLLSSCMNSSQKNVFKWSKCSHRARQSPEKLHFCSPARYDLITREQPQQHWKSTAQHTHPFVFDCEALDVSLMSCDPSTNQFNSQLSVLNRFPCMRLAWPKSNVSLMCHYNKAKALSQPSKDQSSGLENKIWEYIRNCMSLSQ